MTDKVLEQFILWQINTSGLDIEKNLLNLAKHSNGFIVFQLVVALILSACRIASNEELWIHFLFQTDSNFKKIGTFLVKFLQFLGGASIISHCGEVLYCTAHYRFQFIMFNEFIKKLTKEWEFVKDDELLMNSNYQKEINFRLKFHIARHVQFLL